MYLRIQNLGEIPLAGIRLLGLSNKSAEKIGQFGTGLKETIALAMRKNLELVVFSGTTKVTFEIQAIDGHPEVCFKIHGESRLSTTFKNNEPIGMGFSPTLGQRDWTTAWQMLRELFCNAIDEGGIKYDYCSDIVGEEGTTTVYLQLNPELIDKVDVIESLIIPLRSSARQPVIASPRASSKLRVFCKGVWIQDSVIDSLFDYNIDDLKLNESRSADWHEVMMRVTQLLGNTLDPSIVDTILSNLQVDSFAEISQINSWYAPDKPAIDWVKYFHRKFGSNAVICKTLREAEILLKNNKIPIQFTGVWFKILESWGVPSASKVLNEDVLEGREFVATPGGSRELFNSLWKKLDAARCVRGKLIPSLKFFKQGSENGNLKHGEYKDGVCMINERVAGSREERVTMLEEFAHHISAADDATIDFQNYLIDTLEVFVNES